MTHQGAVTVVGNGVAGYACAARLAERHVPVTLVGPGLPCDRPPLSKRALATGRIPHFTDSNGLVSAGITHLDGWASSVDLQQREFVFTPRTGPLPRTIQFELLVWATGLEPTRPTLPGCDAAHQNADPAGFEALLGHVVVPGKRILVIGAGLIGTETAATLARNHHVTLVDRGSSPLQRLHPTISVAAEAALHDLNVDIVSDSAVEFIEPAVSGTHQAVGISGGIVLECDIVIAAAGVRPTVPPELDRSGFLETNEELIVRSLDGVWACGDVALFPHPRFGRLTVPHVDNARASGQHVAEAILGSRSPYTQDPYWFSDIGRLRIQEIGWRAAVCEWDERDGLHLGFGSDGRPACVVLLNSPQRLREARTLLAAS